MEFWVFQKVHQPAGPACLLLLAGWLGFIHYFFMSMGLTQRAPLGLRGVRLLCYYCYYVTITARVDNTTSKQHAFHRNFYLGTILERCRTIFKQLVLYPRHPEMHSASRMSLFKPAARLLLLARRQIGTRKNVPAVGAWGDLAKCSRAVRTGDTVFVAGTCTYNIFAVSVRAEDSTI